MIGRILDWLNELVSGSSRPTGSTRRALPRKTDQEYAVIGLGRFGSSLSMELERSGYEVLGIDSDMALVQKYKDQISQTVQLDSADEAALREVDITSFDTVVVAIGSNFEANLMTTVALKAMGVKRVICKAATTRQRDILKAVGADRVILPESEGGQRLARELAAPRIVDEIELSDRYRVTELTPFSWMINRSLRESKLVEKFHVSVIALQRLDEVMINPTADTVVRETDLIVVLGSTDDVAKLCTSRD